MNKEEKYESTVRILTEFLEDNEQYGDDWSEEKKGLSDLLAEVKRLRVGDTEGA